MSKHEPRLGELAGQYESRDAVHIAIAPVVAIETLRPGEHVGLSTDGRGTKLATAIGIVDPFLKDSVKSGERFWVFLYPRTITSLRHEWTHPAFAKAEPRAFPESEAFLTDLGARTWCLALNRLQPKLTLRSKLLR